MLLHEAAVCVSSSQWQLVIACSFLGKIFEVICPCLLPGTEREKQAQGQPGGLMSKAEQELTVFWFLA